MAVSIIPSDRRLYEMMKQSDADGSMTRVILHYLYFPYKAAAMQSAETFKTRGYNTRIRYSESGDDWLLLAEKIIVMDEHIIREERRLCEQTAFEYNGVYDGWETAS